jgi:hypothetical protein
MLLDLDAVRLLQEIVHSYHVEFADRFHTLLSPVVPSFIPRTLHGYLAEVDRVKVQLDRAFAVLGQTGDEEVEIADVLAPTLRNAIIWVRLRTAEDVERRRAKVAHPELAERLDAELQPFDAFLNAAWFQQAKPKRAPQLTDFFPIELVEAHLEKSAGCQPHARSTRSSTSCRLPICSFRTSIALAGPLAFAV